MKYVIVVNPVNFYLCTTIVVMRLDFSFLSSRNICIVLKYQEEKRLGSGSMIVLALTNILLF